MGWLSWYVGYGEKRKDIILKNVVDIKNFKVLKCEEKGSNIWLIAEEIASGKKYANLFLTSYKNGEFAYKDISIDMSPYYWNCSKRFYEMCKEIYKDDDTGYAKEWLNNWVKNNIAKNEQANKIKNLKVGDIVEFKTANYANQRQWQVSSINGAKVLFEGYNLKGWKKQEFDVVDEFDLSRKYIATSN